MKLTTKAEGLSKKLAQHANVIQQKSSTFTSDAVLLSVDGTVLQLTSTDLTTYLVNAEPAEVAEPGRALVHSGRRRVNTSPSAARYTSAHFRGSNHAPRGLTPG